MAEYQSETCGIHDCGAGCGPMPMAIALQRHHEIEAGLGIPRWQEGEPCRFVRTDYGPRLHEVPEWWTL
jgi:hypothetical protein